MSKDSEKIYHQKEEITFESLGMKSVTFFYQHTVYGLINIAASLHISLEFHLSHIKWSVYLCLITSEF